MPNKYPESYGNANDETWTAEASVRYDADRHPEVAETLEALNQLALVNEVNACISHPKGNPEGHAQAVRVLEGMEKTAVDHGLEIISFDIDLTLKLDEDDEGVINPDIMLGLQQAGYIVGTCSDRSPLNQLETLRALGQEPQFCIPKEMLEWTRRVVPGSLHLHVGDDQSRDRDIAINAGWQHRWPQEFPQL